MRSTFNWEALGEFDQLEGPCELNNTIFWGGSDLAWVTVFAS